MLAGVDAAHLAAGISGLRQSLENAGVSGKIPIRHKLPGVIAVRLSKGGGAVLSKGKANRARCQLTDAPQPGRACYRRDGSPIMLTMRRSVAFIVCFQLQVAFLQAPFLHLHERVENDHVRHSHRAFIQTLHPHFPQAIRPASSASGPELRAVQDRNEAKFLTWFQAKLEAKPVVLSSPVETLAFSLPREIYYRAPIHTRHAHDPPALSPNAPRAPPL